MTAPIRDLRWNVVNRIPVSPLQRFLIAESLGDEFWGTLNRGVSEALVHMQDVDRWENEGGAQ